MYSLASATGFIVTNITRLIVLVWDIYLTLFNFIAPSKRPGHVMAQGQPGAGGKWPEYIAPQEGDSRSACPALNAMANHGILPRNGKNIPFKELSQAASATYNFGETFSFTVSNFSAGMLGKGFERGTFNLADLNVHNGIEHDASITRDDSVHQPDQGRPNATIIEALLKSATGKDAYGNPQLTIEDVAWYMAKRRIDAKASNPNYSLSLFHRAFGFTNTSFLLTVFGGRVSDLEKILLEERLPEGWEPACKEQKGLSLSVLAVTALKVEVGAIMGRSE
ncbi:chloroperoxidase-like protein [Collybia nuda]|uniref:Chloroperoxidase-like protein n=1 Tax=Collybia nuda TaxID=64659 RepID=A0A9P5Y153_9AGAR|nr:chloroperoxidase-like protein [Collybia nuda]